jgi:hypothetical protein
VTDLCDQFGNQPQDRFFDPACGSGNFLVIGYEELRAIEAEINRLRDEADLTAQEVARRGDRGWRGGQLVGVVGHRLRARPLER